MKYGIIVRRLAERDLEEAEDWYNEQQFGLGSEFHETINDLFARLAESPRIYLGSMVPFIVPCCADFPTSCIS